MKCFPESAATAIVASAISCAGLMAAWPHGAAAQATATATATSTTTTTDDSLYQAFGGRPGLAALMDDFVDRLASDPRTAEFFATVDKPHLKAQLTDQLCELAGGPCHLVGPAMKKVHAGLDIGKRDFNALVEILQDAMEAKAIPFPVQNRMLAKLAPMHRDIVSR